MVTSIRITNQVPNCLGYNVYNYVSFLIVPMELNGIYICVVKSYGAFIVLN